MTESVAEATYLSIQCSLCGETIQKPVASLTSMSNMTCKGCGAVIDLADKETRLLIAETAEHCKRLDRKLSKIA